jgi:hypothetical protein
VQTFLRGDKNWVIFGTFWPLSKTFLVTLLLLRLFAFCASNRILCDNATPNTYFGVIFSVKNILAKNPPPVSNRSLR